MAYKLEGCLKKEVIHDNLVVLTFADGRTFSITTDDGTAADLAHRLTDWSDTFRREDAADEVTQEIKVA